MADGNQTAPTGQRLTALFDAHALRLYRLARRLTPRADDARDLVQDTFVKAAQAIQLIPEGHSAAEAWLVRVLVNTRRDRWRREAVRRRFALRVRDPLAGQHPEGAYVDHVDVWRALDTLSPRRRAILMMHELEGMATSSIASLLGIARVTVRWHLAQARRELVRRLKPQLGGVDEELGKSLAGRRPVTRGGTSAP